MSQVRGTFPDPAFCIQPCPHAVLSSPLPLLRPPPTTHHCCACQPWCCTVLGMARYPSPLLCGCPAVYVLIHAAFFVQSRQASACSKLSGSERLVSEPGATTRLTMRATFYFLSSSPCRRWTRERRGQRQEAAAGEMRAADGEERWGDDEWLGDPIVERID